MVSKSDRAKEIKQRQRDIDQGLKDSLATRQGRLFLWDLLENFGVFRTSFDPERPHLTSYAEGSRNEGLRLMARIARVNPEGLALLMREHSERVGKKQDERDHGDESADGRDDERAGG